jgi:hypothetical protein
VKGRTRADGEGPFGASKDVLQHRRDAGLNWTSLFGELAVNETTPPDDEESFAESTLTQAIENQIDSDNPPAAKATFNKLTLVGYEREDILNLMAHVLAIEIDAMLEEDRPFDTQWYETALRALPELPPEKD